MTARSWPDSGPGPSPRHPRSSRRSRQAWPDQAGSAGAGLPAGPAPEPARGPGAGTSPVPTLPRGRPALAPAADQPGARGRPAWRPRPASPAPAAGQPGARGRPAPALALDQRRHAPLGQLIGNDRALDLAGALPDPLHPQLAEEPLGDVLPHVAAAAEHLHSPVSDPAGHLGRV